MKILGIIPARYASTRYPGKPLLEIYGKTMIQRVYEQAKKSHLLADVIVATDDQRIYDHVHAWGGHVVLTATTHPSGTDRCFEAYSNFGEKMDFIINIQGDEPFISPYQIDQLASLCKPNVQLGTLAFKALTDDEIFSGNAIKVVVNTRNEALYFSRNPIPFVRNAPKEKWLATTTFLRHIGIYAYRADILSQITKLEPSMLERCESLEQLRWLENGYSIQVGITHYESYSVDSPEDLERILGLIQEGKIII